MTDPQIRIAARTWSVPHLAPRQNRIVIPGLLALGAEPLAQYGLLCDVVCAALTRAHAIAPEEFEDWPISAAEMLDALPVIVRQAGFLEPRKTPAPITQAHAEPIDFDALIAQFVNFLPGTTPDYWEDALTWPRLKAMREEWRQNPPVACLVAGYLGYAPKSSDQDALAELMAMFPDGRISGTPTLH